MLNGPRVALVLGLSALSGVIAAAYVLDALIAPTQTVTAVRGDAFLLALGAVVAWFAAFMLTGVVLARLLGRRAGP